MPQLLLELPTDLIRLTLSSYVARSPLSHIVARFVCRRFRDLLPPFSQETCQQAHNFCKLAAADGYLNLIKWARTNGCSWNEVTCENAAEGGYLEVLQWLHANGCPWNWYTCAGAAGRGHLEVLQWARANGCPWNEYSCAYAAMGAHLKVLQWARTMGVPGMRSPVPGLHKTVTLRCCNGRSQAVVRTIEIGYAG